MLDYWGDRVFKRTAVIFFSILALSACADKETAEETVPYTTVTATETTAVLSETETSETETSETEETTSETEKDTTVSFEMDRNFVFTTDYREAAADEWLNRPMFLGEPENTGAEVYVMLSDDTWEYYDPFWNETRETGEKVIICHDGVTDILSAEWSQRFGDAFELYSGDYDKDGETEIAAVRYDSGGTVCSVSYLTVFDKTDGHYKSCVFDQYGFINENFSADIDNANSRIKFTLNGSEEYAYDTSSFENEAEDVSLGSLIDYTVDSENITAVYGICIYFKGSALPEILDLKLNVNFRDGEFTLSDGQYTEME